MNIRPFAASDRDYQAVAAIKWAVWPEYRRTVDEFRAMDELWPRDCLLQRLVAEVDGQLVAVGQCYRPFWADDPGRYGVWIDVHPSWQRRGIGGALYAALLGLLAPHQPRTLATETREDRPDSVRFLQRNGFRPVMRHPESWLHVEAVDPARLARARARVQAAGVDIVDLPALQARDPDWKRNWWTLNGLVLQDVPATTALDVPFETFVQSLSSPAFLPEGCFFALAGDDYVGLSQLGAFPGDPQLLETGLTGVLRSHRRLGIATALKLHCIEFARRRGVARIMTRNEENNPMYALNLSLGFRPGATSVEYEKHLFAATTT